MLESTTVKNLFSRDLYIPGYKSMAFGLLKCPEIITDNIHRL